MLNEGLLQLSFYSVPVSNVDLSRPYTARSGE